MNSTPYTVPQRTEKIGELVVSLALCGVRADKIKADPGETNATLAMCEIAMSLPPKWFAHEEKVMIVQLVQYLYGEPKKFLADLSDGTVSFYSRMMEECKNDPTIQRCLPSLEQILTEAHEAHIKQFGVW